MVGAIFAFWYLIFRHFKLTVSLLWKRVSICVLVVPRVVRFLELMGTMRPILNSYLCSCTIPSVCRPRQIE